MHLHHPNTKKKEKQKKGGKTHCIMRLTTRQTNKTQPVQNKNGKIKQGATKVLEGETLTFVEVHDRW